jgi:predicted P-loop ATPase
MSALAPATTIIDVKNDGYLTLHTAKKVASKDWSSVTLKWSDFVRKLSTPSYTNETMEQYSDTKKNDSRFANFIKDVGGYVGGTLKGSTRSSKNVLSRQLIALDLDEADDPLRIWSDICITYGCAAAMHSTHSSTPQRPRIRVLIPLSAPVTPKEYTSITKAIVSAVGLGQVDEASFEPSRAMYWPSCPKDAKYLFELFDAAWLDPGMILDEAKAEELEAAVMEYDPRALTGTPGEFCKKYTVQEAIREFLSDVYEPVSEDRYKLIGANSVGGLVIYGQYCKSFHSNHDDVHGKYLNAYDLVRLKKFGHLDLSIGQGATEGQSTAAMLQWIEDNKLCPVVKWAEELAFDKKGNVSCTRDNIHKILQFDEELEGALHYNVFTQKLMVASDFPWIQLIDRSDMQWNDSDLAGFRAWLETKYNLSDLGRVDDAITNMQNSSAYHPVKEYLREVKWDGESRLDSFFIDFLNANDTPYVRSVTRKALIGAVARIMNPGCKHDHVLVLVGPQGCRKSSTLKMLGGQWYTDSLGGMQGKDAYEQLQGYWIVELSEMSAAKKADQEQIKLFISKQSDNYRAAYARYTIERPRQCAFFGSTNDEEFLKDPTGGRRFWPIKVDKIPVEKYNQLSELYVQQLWAEAVYAYDNGERWYLEEVQEAEARIVQEQYRLKDERLSLIEEFLDTPVPLNWNRMSKEERNMHYSTQISHELNEGNMLRDRVCALEILMECFGYAVKDCSAYKAQEITNVLRASKKWTRTSDKTWPCGPYGYQKTFVRVKEESQQ